ncbi:thioredoxin family protein [Romeria aff. gracilis LEGE 07310]|uniref:Thioredoxin family protein n=1 Tax=Vasconcelosia minhoensis LEGE 07310 TaxID=915328 RepID=A0A8J7AIT2_9CYAN|nr:thioredoxin family protein [Romeria gracilis]MBE9078358.1 thioredoxin family protein [Romeria aff. gracilis LEGE 07310]
MSVNSPELGQRLRNFVIAVVAIGLTLALVLGIQTRTPSASLTELAKSATPLEQALANGKPTFVEFYANWCTSCQAMAGDMQMLRMDYRDRVNFVMLNVDNSNWLPEMLHYRVDGIPHFVFLDDQSEDSGFAVGEVPRAILAENLDALVAHQPLPHGQAMGQASEVEGTPAPPSGSTDPRSHGAQVSQDR